MKELILIISKSLVDKSDEVKVAEVKSDKTAVLELKFTKEDLGQVNGKQGKTANANRNILNATVTNLKQRAVLEILE